MSTVVSCIGSACRANVSRGVGTSRSCAVDGPWAGISTWGYSTSTWVTCRLPTGNWLSSLLLKWKWSNKLKHCWINWAEVNEFGGVRNGHFDIINFEEAQAGGGWRQLLRATHYKRSLLEGRAECSSSLHHCDPICGLLVTLSSPLPASLSLLFLAPGIF